MGQEDILKLLEGKPRLCSKEIAAELEINLPQVSRLIHRMLDRDIKQDKPNEEELKRIMEHYPKVIHGLSRLFVFEVIE